MNWWLFLRALTQPETRFHRNNRLNFDFLRNSPFETFFCFLRISEYLIKRILNWFSAQNNQQATNLFKKLNLIFTLRFSTFFFTYFSWGTTKTCTCVGSYCKNSVVLKLTFYDYLPVSYLYYFLIAKFSFCF